MSTPPDRPTASPNELPAPERGSSLDVREAMWRIRVAWVFGAAWMFTTTSVALTRYAECLGLPLFWYGILGALPFMGALTALPSSYAIARYGRRKRIFLVAGIAYRSVWVPVALIPWVLPGTWWWPSLLVLNALSSLGAYVMSPAVLSWFADVIPARVRGRFFSRWSQGGRIAGLIATLVVAELLDHAVPGGRPSLMRTLSIVFAIAAALGVVDFLWLLPVADVEHRPNPQIRLWALFREPLADRSFRCFLGFNATLTLSIGYLGQYVYLYLTNELGMGNRLTNLMVMVVPTLVSLLVLRVWGRLLDRVGCRPLLILCGVLVVHGAVGWIVVTPEHPWAGYIGVLVAVAAWTGLEMASFNLMLRLGASQGGQRQGSAYLAVNSVVVALAGLLSGLLGGGVAKALGDGWRGSLLGLPLTYHGVLFLISGGLRLAALPWLLGLHEPEARSATATVQYLVARAISRFRIIAGTPLTSGRWWNRGRTDEPDEPGAEK